ncbi:MAG: hypothetical protein K2H20_03090 [Bacilli bacterium]|nr:hypothetical protein [Bacilli bacterium]
MHKYCKVMFGNISGANSEIVYKIGEVNESNNWHPQAENPKEMGGFNYSTYDMIFRWLIRGDTIYDVEIPKDAEVVSVDNPSTPNGVFRTNKIILSNPRIVDDEVALKLYRCSKLPEKSYYKALAGCMIRGYKNTCLELIKMRVNKDNIDLVLSEISDFVKPENSSGNTGDTTVYYEILEVLSKIKEL